MVLKSIFGEQGGFVETDHQMARRVPNHQERYGEHEGKRRINLFGRLSFQAKNGEFRG
jgi:hypothetical protein